MLLAAVRSPVAVLASLMRHRELTWALARREVLDPYAGRALGALWTIGNPLLLVGLYVFLFAWVFPSRMPDQGGIAGDATAYILAGLVPWLGFADSMNRACGSIVANAGLVRQVVFPVETLPAKTVLAAMATQIVMTALVLVYLAVRAEIPWTALFLPALLALQFLAMLGTGLLLATLTVFVRDVREIVAFVGTAGLFLAPILYLPSWIESLSPLARRAIEFNPITHLVRCHRDCLLADGGWHPWSWLVVALFAPACVIVGSVAYRRLHHVMGELV